MTIMANVHIAVASWRELIGTPCLAVPAPDRRLRGRCRGTRSAGWVCVPEIRPRARCRSQGLLVVDPDVHNDLRFRVVPEGQPILPSELGSPPRKIGRRPHGVALSLFVARWIARHRVAHQLGQGPEELDVGIGRKAFRVVLLRAQLRQLLDEIVVKQQGPAMLLPQISTSSSKSSPGATSWPACSMHRASQILGLTANVPTGRDITNQQAQEHG